MQVSLKAMRVHRCLTQAEVAEKIGVDKGTLIRWESGQTFPSAVQFGALCQLYDCSRDDIFLPEEHA